MDFLNEIIYLFDTRRFLAAGLEEAEVALGPPARLAGKLAGEVMDPARHVLKTEIKAATFHGLEIREVDGGLSADVIFDL